jgi:cell division protease FtsH
MDQDRKPADQKNRPGLAFFFVLVTIGVSLLALMMLSSIREYKLALSDFEHLLSQTQYQDKDSDLLVTSDTKSGRIVIRNKGLNNRWDELSELQDIELGKTKIHGKVTLRTAEASDEEPGDKDWTAQREVLFVTKKDDSDQFTTSLISALKRANISYDATGGPSFMERYGFLLFTTALLILFFLWMVRRLGGASGPMQFGRSRGKLHAEEDLKITFNDVAGIDEAVEEVREVVDFLKNPEKYQKLGGRIPRGVLLVGPPGTGKTLLAKAIAGEAGVPFFSMSGSDFVEMFVGVGAARVRDMFQQAEAKAPCIIFIDELDALGKSRGGSMVGGHDEREQTLNALLVEMDGFTSNSGVIVIGATNRPETLDQALMRPGRFDRHVLVDRPDLGGREEILKVHVKNVKLAEGVDLNRIAAITPGFAGAELANLVNEAALLAARGGKSAVGMEEFNDGVERVTAGLEKKRRVMNDDEKQRVAYHESGHALVAYSLPNTDPVHKVSIIPRGFAALGYTMQRPEGDRFLATQSELESQIQILLAGTLAEEMIYPDISTGAQNDLERASKIARAMVTQYGMSRLGRVNYSGSTTSPFLSTARGESDAPLISEKTSREIDDEVRRIIDESIEKVRHILEVRQSALIALTDRLIEVESVDSDELKRIIDENSPTPVVVPGTEERHRSSELRKDSIAESGDEERAAN